MEDYSILKRGDIGPISNKKIKHIIQQGVKYIVFMDEDDDILWMANDEYSIPSLKSGDILNQVGYLKNLSEKVLTNKSEIFNTKCLIAKAFARLIVERDKQSAKELLNSIQSRLFEIGKENYRIIYLISSFSATITVIILLLLCWYFRVELILKYNMTVFYGLICSLGGGIGAFISTFLRSRKYDANIHISKKIHILDGFLRVFYGIIAGLVIYVGIKSNLILGFINNNKTSYLLFFLSSIAGASESLLPNIIIQTEDKNSNDK